MLIPRAKVIVNEVTRSLNELRELETGQTGVVNIGITQNYGLYLVPPLLAELQTERPGMRFDVVTGGFLDLVEKVTTGKIDVAFGLLGSFETTDDLVVERLKEHHSRAIARARHPLACMRQISAAELARARWATLRGEGFQRNFARFFEQSGLRTPVQVLKTDSIELIRSFVVNTDTLTVLPPDVFKREIDDGTVVFLDSEAPAEITQLGLIFRAGGFISPRVQLVADRIRTIVARPQHRPASQTHG
jgi:DNA-binding transcriptional LysR family regulator